MSPEPEAPVPGSAVASIDSIAPFPDVREVKVSLLHDGKEYKCPSCEAPIPTRKQIRLAKPAKYEDALVDVLKCPFCNFLFAPKTQKVNVLSE